METFRKHLPEYLGDIVVVACGAINSAALLLRSHNDQHPSGQVNNYSRSHID
ncbi:MAG: hypothetical protein RMY16_27665 [Nostoc sp. DedQUE12b]|uniref:hypothetical protein n=1 Tax=Nostoc sp. DedQUE12b TaxID=3075398 RepID=UPI002AD50F5B|nr:hypothetical protein [Nostoc sp. DedQUE12b]MDZ8089300.1 hypothetical protein [Nostoc sp. DedQUE12b]